jgi:hypothetical protein
MKAQNEIGGIKEVERLQALIGQHDSRLVVLRDRCADLREQRAQVVEACASDPSAMAQAKKITGELLDAESELRTLEEAMPICRLDIALGCCAAVRELTESNEGELAKLQAAITEAVATLVKQLREAKSLRGLIEPIASMCEMASQAGLQHYEFEGLQPSQVFKAIEEAAGVMLRGEAATVNLQPLWTAMKELRDAATQQETRYRERREDAVRRARDRRAEQILGVQQQ